MGLLDSVLNPNVLGLMGLAQGLGQAAAPSRMPVPLGVAASQGMQGLLGGVGQGLQTAMMMQRMKLIQDLNGDGSGPAPGSQAALTASGQTPSDGTTGAMFSGGTAPAGPGPTKYAESLLGPVQPAQGGPSGMTPQQMFKRGLTMSLLGLPGGGQMMELAGKYDPATLDSVKTLAAAHIDPNSQEGQAILTYGMNKPVNVRGFGYLDALGPHPLPTNNIPGTMSVPMPSGGWGVQTLPGAQAALQGNQAAETVGAGKGVDAQGNPVPLTTPVAPASPAPASTAPLGNNNPGALMPGGKLASYPDMQTGLQALDQNLQNYHKQGVNTLSGVINKWAPPGQNDTQAYINDVAGRLGIKPDQPIDLSNPVQRQAIGTAIALHENGPSAVFGAPQQPKPVYGAPPLGAVEKANENAAANVKIGSGQYDTAQKEAQNLGVYRQALNDMWRLANDPKAQFGPGTPTIARIKAIASNIPGLDMTGAQTSQDVMTKLANFIGISQLGQGGQTGTDAQLNTILHSVPNGEMTNEAMKQVIPLLVSQLDVKQARSNVASNLKKQNGSDFSALPDTLSKFNSLADPGTISIGLGLAGLKGNGLTSYVAGLKKQYGDQFPQIMARVKQLDGMGAFNQ